MCDTAFYAIIPVDMFNILLDEWQTVWTLIRCHVLQHLIWVYTVYSGQSVPILRVNTVTLKMPITTGPDHLLIFLIFSEKFEKKLYVNHLSSRFFFSEEIRLDNSHEMPSLISTEK